MVVNKEQHSNKNTTRNQNPILRDKRKSIIVEQFERSQHQDQSKRVSWHNLTIGPLISKYPQK